MANLTGMPISSLPETTLQEGDQVVGYRADTGKAYRTDLADEITSLREEVSALKDSLSDLDIFSRGTAISSGDDLNDYTTYGRYNSASSAISSTLENVPMAGAGFALFVMIVGGTIVQIIVTGGSSSSSNLTYFYIRTRTSSGDWKDWYGVTATKVS